MKESTKTQQVPTAGPDLSTSSSTTTAKQQQQHQPTSEDRTQSTTTSQQANPKKSKGEDNNNKNNNENTNRDTTNKNTTKMPPKPTPTHFLCIPLVTTASRPQLTRSLAAFREVTVPNPSSAYGALPIPEEAIRPVGTIHLTLGVMSFLEPKVHHGGKSARHGRDAGSGRDVKNGPPQEDGGSKDRTSRSGSRNGSGSRSGSGSEEKGGSLSGLRKLEEAKALLKSLKLREIWQEVLRQSQTQVTAVPVPQPRDEDDSDHHEGGAPLTVGTAEEKGEGLEAGPGTAVRDVQPRSQPQAGTGKKTDEQEEEGPKITLRGLHAMQPPSKAAVLYTPPVDPLGHLQRFCEKVKDVFVQKGLMMEEGGRPLLLHATVVNTIYVKGRKGQQQGGGNMGGGRGGGGGKKGHHHSHRGGRKERLTIDAREILERYEEYTWMEDVKVEKVAICKMGAKEIGVNGAVVDEAYEVEEEVDF